MPHWNGGHSRCSLSRNHPGQSNTASASFVCSVLAQRFFNRPSHDQIFCRILHYDVELEEEPVANMNGKYWVENYGGPDFWLPGKNEQVQFQWFNNLNNLPSSGWYWLETAQWERALSWDIFLMVRHYFSVCCGGMNFFRIPINWAFSRKICWSIGSNSWGGFLCKVANCLPFEFVLHFLSFRLVNVKGGARVKVP